MSSSIAQFSLGMFMMVNATFSGNIFNQINSYRMQLGLKPVVVSARTCGYAAVRVKEAMGSWSHDKFYGRAKAGKSPYHGFLVENLAQGFTPGTIFYEWKNSPTHNQMMKANVTEMCVMTAKNRDGVDYYAMEGLRSN
jgi:uncharacterized protein YkwD